MGTINYLHPTIAKPEAARSGSFRVSCRFCVFTLLLLCASLRQSLADETNPPPATSAGSLQDTNIQEVLRAVLGLADQIRSNQLAIEQNGQEAKEAAARNAELLSNGLHGLQATFTSQQQALSDRNTRELHTIQSSNRVVVMLGGIFAAIVGLTLLLIGYFQWRISKAWTHISHVLPAPRGFGGTVDSKALGSGGSGSNPSDPAEASNARLLHAVEELETRVSGLEHNSAGAHGVRTAPVSTPGNGNAPRARAVAVMTTEPDGPGGNAQTRIEAWLDRGQSLLKQNDWEGALQCFDEVLALDPNHGEALVKKGASLERLKKLNEAFECYDRAIAADESMTVAYLHKGGLCSRLERFKEALECYEKALRTHSDWDG